MAEPYYLGPFDRIVAFHFANVVIMNENTSSFVLLEALEQLGEERLSNMTNVTVKVTGPITHLEFSPEAQWDLFAPGNTVEEFTLINESLILGEGGDGGNAGFYTGGLGTVTDGEDGEDGGDAISLDGWDVTITNEDGHIFGGAGGGGGGGSVFLVHRDSNGTNTATVIAAGGGGGGGPGAASDGADGLINYTLGPPVMANAARAAIYASDPDGDDGDEWLLDNLGTVVGGSGVESTAETITALSTDGGDGGISGTSPLSGAGGTATVVSGTATASGGAGGGGGADFAEPGSDGAAASASDYEVGESFVTDGGDGGAAGKAIDLAGGSVTWTSGNEPARVKGAVS